jgi:hypothetical protein
MTSAAESLDLLLWRVGLCWQAPRAPQQASCMGDAVIAAASPLAHTMLLAQSEKCQGSGVQIGRINMRSATRRCGYFGAVGPPNSLAIAWGRCPQTPEIYRFGPGAWFRRRITVVSRTSICCAYHVNSPRGTANRGTVPLKTPLKLVPLKTFFRNRTSVSTKDGQLATEMRAQRDRFSVVGLSREEWKSRLSHMRDLQRRLREGPLRAIHADL